MMRVAVINRRSDFAVPDELVTIAARGRAERTGGPGRTVSWQIWGAGPPVMLLHGNFGAWSHWIRNVEALAEHHTVFAPDIPGFGDSDMPETVTLNSIAAALSLGFRQLAGPSIPVRIVGFSLGCTIAGFVARQLGPQAAMLVMVSAGQIGLSRATIPPLLSWRGLPQAAQREAHRRNLATMMLADFGTVDDLAIAIQAANTQRARVKTAPLTATHPLRDVLSDLRCPIRGIWGGRDATIGPFMAERIAFMRSLTPPSEAIVIDGAGHWVAFEAAQAFNAALLRLLNDSEAT